MYGHSQPQATQPSPTHPTRTQPNQPYPTAPTDAATTALAPPHPEPQAHRLRGLGSRQLPSVVSFGFAANEGRQEPDAEVAPGADLQTPLAPAHRALVEPPMAHGWALENGDSNKQNGAHRLLPPMSHGWALENGPNPPPALGLVEEGKQAQAQPAAEPAHRMLLPMSHGWTLENGGSKKQEGGPHRGLEEGAAAVKQEQEGNKAPTEDQDRRGPACVFGGLC